MLKPPYALVDLTSGYCGTVKYCPGGKANLQILLVYLRSTTLGTIERPHRGAYWKKPHSVQTTSAAIFPTRTLKLP